MLGFWAGVLVQLGLAVVVVLEQCEMRDGVCGRGVGGWVWESGFGLGQRWMGGGDAVVDVRVRGG